MAKDKNEIIVDLISEHFGDHTVMSAEEWSEILYMADGEISKQE